MRIPTQHPANPMSEFRTVTGGLHPILFSQAQGSARDLCKGAIPSKLAVPGIWAGRRAGRQLIYSRHQALHPHTKGSPILQHRILSYSCISGLIPLVSGAALQRRIGVFDYVSTSHLYAFKKWVHHNDNATASLMTLKPLCSLLSGLMTGSL